MKLELSEAELRAVVMDKLAKRNCWGAKYLPLDTLVNWLGRNVKRNGKRVKAAIKSLVKDGYALLHKKGDTVSLNPRLSKEIIEYTIKNLPRPLKGS